ncbi:MAG: nucleotidyl transferase AbiEii/AbiGii toxin family protein [Candidatus Korarchaeum sp.]|nr:nucleotidyl transferase AbiEii/AbiGii toxin family protein [Candidatus Korarchaeum sp.]
MEPRRISLIKILKGKLLKIAELQDAVILELSRRFNFVLHGGLAVWRVYGGKRFSLDIDIYHDNPRELVNIPFKSTRVLTASGVLYLRIKDDVEIELEASPMFEEVVEADYWLVDGSSIVVRTLKQEELVREKVRAFLERGKAEDLYDIYYLLDLCDPGLIREDMRVLSGKLRMPDDFSGLKELILMEPLASML